ncbi:MAG: M67 family metallopeptidase [Actinomycetota bacterium]|nr:M67 family metallopeptidase [Actinomycetota bacterium]
MRIDRALLDDIVAHAVRDAPNECCGIVAAQHGAATTVHALENQAASPFRFEVDGLKMFRLLEQIESGGGELGAIYHSHTRSDPVPSQTDVNFSFGWPGVEWIIVGVSKNSAEPEVRSFLIDDGEVSEVELELT